jgi:hypothetical protein
MARGAGEFGGGKWRLLPMPPSAALRRRQGAALWRQDARFADICESFLFALP